MSGFLFDELVFGPVRSRRFGVSLGMNLLPTAFKYCTFNCIYCECGWSHVEQSKNVKFSSRSDIRKALEKKLIELIDDEITPDNITFAGNGEPTIHPEFAGIIDDTIELRNKHFRKAKISVLSNSSMLHRRDVFNALQKVDNNVLKLDAGSEKMFRAINQVKSTVSLKQIIKQLKGFKENLTIQTLFIRGKYNGETIDNTTDEELKLWLSHIKEINPEYVMVYPIARATPADNLEKIPEDELDSIAEKVEQLGIKTKIYY